MILLRNNKIDTHCPRRLFDVDINCSFSGSITSCLHVHAQYEIEGSYLATVMDGMFITLPTALDVRLCLMMNGHLCMFNQVLYPVECTSWCSMPYSSMIKNK